MQSTRNSILSYVNLRRSTDGWHLASDENVLMQSRRWCSSTPSSSDPILNRVIGLVKKYDKIDASKFHHLPNIWFCFPKGSCDFSNRKHVSTETTDAINDQSERGPNPEYRANQDAGCFPRLWACRPSQ